MHKVNNSKATNAKPCDTCAVFLVKPEAISVLMQLKSCKVFPHFSWHSCFESQSFLQVNLFSKQKDSSYFTGKNRILSSSNSNRGQPLQCLPTQWPSSSFQIEKSLSASASLKNIWIALQSPTLISSFVHCWTHLSVNNALTVQHREPIHRSSR